MSWLSIRVQQNGILEQVARRLSEATQVELARVSNAQDGRVSVTYDLQIASPNISSHLDFRSQIHPLCAARRSQMRKAFRFKQKFWTV